MNIFQNLNEITGLDIEIFNNLVHYVYQKNTDEYDYFFQYGNNETCSICEYLEDLLCKLDKIDDNHGVKIVWNFILNYGEYYNSVVLDIENNINEYNNITNIDYRIANGFSYKKSGDFQQIIPHNNFEYCEHILERQTNAIQYQLSEECRSEIVTLFNQIVSMKYLNRKNYYICFSYLNYITSLMLEHKKDIIKDSLNEKFKNIQSKNNINHYLLNCQNEMNRWQQKQNKIIIDTSYLSHVNSYKFETYYLRLINRIYFHEQYYLPISVLNESVENNNLWKYVFNKKGFNGELIPPPKEAITF